MPTKIPWVINPDGTPGEVLNVVSGCTPVSKGCANCYAKRLSRRLKGRYGYPADDPFRVTLHPEKLAIPLKKRKPTTFFVCSMGDLFHPDVPFEFIAAVIGIAARRPDHIFLLLTKRAQRMKGFFDWLDTKDASLAFINPMPQLRFGCAALHHYLKFVYNSELFPVAKTWPLPNLWLGVSAENQKMADERIPILLQIPAAGRFVSVEPMLGPVDLRSEKLRWCDKDWDSHECDYAIDHLDCVIVGGENGPGARPMSPEWVRPVRDQCNAANIPFFFKGWGQYEYARWFGSGGWVRKNVGSKVSGHMLDGKEHRHVPWEMK